jgi:L-seryl-tRNA(Ser) seleniumtransferase
MVVDACRAAVAEARARILQGDEGGFDPARVEHHLQSLLTPNLVPVINATGVVVHTNLGRAPLSERAIARITEVARGYCNIELDLDEGERGSRYAHVVAKLVDLTGAEDAMVVNNCAAATLLVLGALAFGREVVVSRGELVEIGGGFRMPDVLRQSGCTLVEVGTTNRTHLADYEAALTPSTALLLKVHKSNFAMLGFVEETSAAQLVALGRTREVPVFEDLGTGSLLPLEDVGLTPEYTVRARVAAGIDVVAFSGDKLLGGPQAGIIVGRRELVTRLTKHPLARAVRVDKLTVAALEATLDQYREGHQDQTIPVRAMLTVSLEMLEARARRLSAMLSASQVRHRVVPTVSKVGGGSLPLAEPPSFALAIEGPDAVSFHHMLRAGTPSIVARIVADEVWVDVRCLTEAECEVVASRIATSIRGTPC